MKNLKFAAALAILMSSMVAHAFDPIQNEKNYQVYLDLNEVTNDQLPVQMVTPIIFEDSVQFHMPRVVPGTYDVHDYGRFVRDFKAFDASGNELNTRVLDTNRWVIYNAKKLYKITYRVEDTYDYPEKTGIFEPAGTSLEDSVYLLNNFGFVGYLNGYKDHPFILKVEKPKGFYGSTALVGQLGDSVDTYTTKDYFTLHDNPIMYCKPDTAIRKVGGAEVLVSVYSPTHKVNAKESMDRISAVLDAAAQYLGGKLPVEKYAVLIYCVPMNKMATSYGALEHHTSTVLYMPEFEGDRFYSGVRDITSHEFLHIITPLGIHSQMIANFNFIDPEMSENIWLYEGVTEYNSHLIQVRSGIYTLDQFLDVIKSKMESNDQYDQGIPLTMDSKFTLSFFKDQYGNFYQKGALAGMALDLKLIELSSGKYRLVDLLEDLGETYGPDTFFVDEDLFDIITERTYPEMREFFARYYEGADTLPLHSLLANVGILYKPEVEAQHLTVGNIDFGYNFETDRIMVGDVKEIDEFGRDLGWQKGDEIVEFQGQKVDLGNLSDVITDFYKNTELGDKVKITVARPQPNGEYKEVNLKAKARLGTYMEKHFLKPMDNPTPEQLALRKVWINQ